MVCNIPIILYADDAFLMAVNSYEQMQELLKVLELFEFIFDMEVNLTKTKVIIFRCGKKLPKSVANMCFIFTGIPLAVVEEEKYLGIMMHSWKDMCHAASQRAIVARKSLHAMLSRCKKGGISQPAFLCRIFDVLILPALSYGAHVWGPSMFQRLLTKPLDSKNDSD